MKSRLDRLESQLQTFFENRLGWLPWRSRQPRLASIMVEALRKQLLLEKEISQPVPNHFHILVAPPAASEWLGHPEWQKWLEETFLGLAQELDLLLTGTPVISVTGDANLSSDEIRVIASFEMQEVNSTAVLEGADASQKQMDLSSAYLLTGPDHVFPLLGAVTNIGRLKENHLVLEDVRVSRTHAQIRQIRGEHVLFDLNSTGGSFINGVRITQQTLRPGDVISLAGVTLIYAQDSGGHSPTGTSPSSLHS